VPRRTRRRSASRRGIPSARRRQSSRRVAWWGS
jgi:hypothetical protein